MRRFLPLGACLALAAYYGYFAQVSLRLGLTHDDLMNMQRAVTASWPTLGKESLFFFLPSDQYRPVGAIFYRICFDLFGPVPFPLHLVLMLAWALGLGALFLAARRLSQSSEVGLLTVLLAAHHSNRPFYYINAGFCYDILCHLFYFTALAYYLGARAKGRLRERDLLLLTGLFILALGSKEMAVSLPFVLAACEWWSHDRDWRFPALSAVMAALFVGGRVLSASGISAAGSYEVVLGYRQWMESWNDWLAHLAYVWPAPLATSWVLAFFALVILGTWISGDRALRIATVLLLVGAGPVVFLRPMRGLEAVSIPLAGLALIVAWWLTRLSWIVPWSGRAPLLFVLVLVLLWDCHARAMPPEEAMQMEGRFIAKVWTEWRKIVPPIRATSKVLIRNDPFPPPFVWATTFIGQIDQGSTLWIRRADNHTPPPDPADFDFVLTWENERFVTLKAPGVPQ